MIEPLVLNESKLKGRGDSVLLQRRHGTTYFNHLGG